MRYALFYVDCAMAAPAAAQGAPAIDYPGFVALTAEVATLRETRLIGWDRFRAESAAEGAILLDTRSAADFARGHVAGAVNLPFSEFTDAKLRAVLGEDTARPVYIYCNNNFADDVAPVTLKRAPLALNIPTFVNLVGYGYGNVWELGEQVTLAAIGAEWVAG